MHYVYFYMYPKHLQFVHYKKFDGIGTGVLSQSSLKPLGCVHVHSTQLTYYMYQQFVSRCLAVFLQKNIFSFNMRVNCLTSHMSDFSFHFNTEILQNIFFFRGKQCQVKETRAVATVPSNSP